MISDGWPAMMSNTVLNATCNKGQPFHEAYLAASKNILPTKNSGITRASEVKIEKMGLQEVVFVLLYKPIEFKGLKQYYF